MPMQLWPNLAFVALGKTKSNTVLVVTGLSVLSVTISDISGTYTTVEGCMQHDHRAFLRCICFILYNKAIQFCDSISASTY